MAKVPADLKVCIFDVFGTVVDWRDGLIEDLPKLGRNGPHGLDELCRRLARPLSAAKMARVRGDCRDYRRPAQGSFQMLVKRSLKHPARAVGVHAPLAQARPWPDRSKASADDEEICRVDAQHGNVALLIGGQAQRHPVGPLLLGRPSTTTSPVQSPGVVDSMYQAAPGDAGRAQWRPEGGEMRPVDGCTAQGARPQPEDRPQSRRRLGCRRQLDHRGGEEDRLLAPSTSSG